MTDTPGPTTDTLEKIEADTAVHVKESKWKHPQVVQAEADSLLERRRALARGEAPRTTPLPAEGMPEEPKTVGDLFKPDANEPTTPDEAFASIAPELGLTQEETQAWLTWAKEQPDGEVYSQERELRSWPWDVRQEAAQAANTALERLGAGVAAHLTRRGLLHHPRVFTGLVRLGMQLQDIDDEIAEVMKQNPADPRLPALSRKRRGGRLVLKVGR